MPDPNVSSPDSELQARIEQALDAQYEVVREIGRGGMGIVYLARDRRLKRNVAIKLLPPELAFRSEIRTRFLREAETAAQLSHPNIVPIYSVDERDGLVYFVMAFIDGQNLGERLQSGGPLGCEEGRRVLRDVADALAYAHSRGVVHRDIKPDNILLCEDDERVMVTDFGIARAVTEGADSRLTATGLAIGTPHYMSPEQAAGERSVDGRSDLYSLGVLAYQMLVGETPFVASSTPALLVKHISEQPRPISERVAGIPDDLASAIMRLLEKDPNRRFPDAGALVQALDRHEVQRLEPAPVPRRSASLPARPVEHDEAEYGAPTAGERARWEERSVAQFRRRFGTYAGVNGIFVVLALFGGADLLGITAMWTILMAYWYARLWTNGYDWRDVFRQPRDRLFFDVAAETVDDARAIFDMDKRAQVRERERRRRLAMARSDYPAPEQGRLASGRETAGADRDAGRLPSSSPYATQVQQAMIERDEVVRQWTAMPRRDRDRVPEVLSTARELADRVSELARQLTELDRTSSEGGLQVIDREIAELEAQASPAEGAAAENRFRRLALLRRQRRGVVDLDARRAQALERFESCALALRNLRMDLALLNAGTHSHQQVTALVQRAQQLANDMDGIVSAENAVARGHLRPVTRSPDGV